MEAADAVGALAAVVAAAVVATAGVTAVAVIDEALTGSERLPLATAAARVLATSLAFGTLLALLKINSASTTTDPLLKPFTLDFLKEDPYFFW